ncbi:thioredoxin isoform X1 [Pteropus medius]|uniref:Thioredoxin isoform X1 n=1 Tax=Pteropus vampyrus TaxID=132908 RepID=A0A6P6CP61_PTEVA|nr:thioredoxin isoform X1 [Pteropus vampyrus]XP_023389228.1 thioredoxin isoform X2 [Pteropus vampyrus]XP_039726621.1 thioredoxin isoform X1 [Pteropus giganteus]
MVKQIDSKDAFEEALTSAGSKLVVVDFSATWCGPCKMIKPFFHSLSEKYSNVVFLEVDVDDCQDVASECEVKCMPTFQFFKNGKRWVNFLELIRKNLNPPSMNSSNYSKNIASHWLFKSCNFFSNLQKGKTILNSHLVTNENKILILPFLKLPGVFD